MDTKRRNPTIFISSTCYDLKHVRDSLRKFFDEYYGFDTMLSEYNSFPVDPCNGTIENCLSNVDNYADLFILIIGKRYGHVTDNGKSITNLEYLHAKVKRIPIFVFVDKQIEDTLSIWEKNKDGDYSSIVDNTKIFEFVLDIKIKDSQWIYTFDTIEDITTTMKNQLRLIFSDGLRFESIKQDDDFSIYNSNLPNEPLRMVIEKPFGWQYKFFASLLKNEFRLLQDRKWDLQYGFCNYTIKIFQSSLEFIDDLSNKFEEVSNIVKSVDTLVNQTFKDAIDELGVESDLQMMIYASKKLVYICEQLISWSLYFKALRVEKLFQHLIDLICDLPKSVLQAIDDFVEKFYIEIMMIPAEEDEIPRNIVFKLEISIANIEEINQEIAMIKSCQLI